MTSEALASMRIRSVSQNPSLFAFTRNENLFLNMGGGSGRRGGGGSGGCEPRIEAI